MNLISKISRSKNVQRALRKTARAMAILMLAGRRY